MSALPPITDIGWLKPDNRMLSCRPHMEGTMADNLRKRGSPDSKTINMKEAWEKNYWKRKFRVSGQALAGAVRAVGKSAKKVEAYLKNK